MVNEKFKDVKFNFPKDPMNTEFIKIWQETIEREDFKNLKKQVLKEEFEAYMNELIARDKPMKPEYISLLTNPPQPRVICGNCYGGYLERTFNFCHQCGQKLDWDSGDE